MPSFTLYSAQTSPGKHSFSFMTVAPSHPMLKPCTAQFFTLCPEKQRMAWAVLATNTNTDTMVLNIVTFCCPRSLLLRCAWFDRTLSIMSKVRNKYYRRWNLRRVRVWHVSMSVDVLTKMITRNSIKAKPKTKANANKIL